MSDDDRGLAALKKQADRMGLNMATAWWEEVLGERGIFLPEGFDGISTSVPEFVEAIRATRDVVIARHEAEVARLRKIEAAARDVDAMWSGEDGEVIGWLEETGDCLNDLRTALEGSEP